MNVAVFWLVAPCGLVQVTMLMEAASTSETSVNFYQTTRRNNPQDVHIHLSPALISDNDSIFVILHRNDYENEIRFGDAYLGLQRQHMP
jgi:hypothetical protein